MGGRKPLIFQECWLALRQVFAAQTPVVTAAHQARCNADAAGVADLVQRHQFLRHHGVQPWRHDGTGHDFDALASLDIPLPRLACQRRTNHFELKCRSFFQLSPGERIAIHRRVVMRRHIQRRNQIGCQNPAQRLQQRQFNGFLNRGDQSTQKILHRVGRHGLRVVAL